MDVSPKTLREVEFREKMRGYHPEDVDQFLERVAAGLEVLQDRLRQALERAQKAEAQLSESGGADDTLRRTLVLAQRTADLAIQEARDQAARILAGAEQQAQAMIAGAEDEVRRTHERTLVDVEAEITALQADRGRLQLDVAALTGWVHQHRARLTEALQSALTTIEGADLLSAPPVSAGPGPVSAGPGPSAGAATAGPGSGEPMAKAGAAAGPPTSGGPPPGPGSGSGAGDPPPRQAEPGIDAGGRTDHGGDREPGPGGGVRAAGPDARSEADGPDTMVWHLADDSDEVPVVGGDGDPYFAQLRQAVNDRQPLGPAQADGYDDHEATAVPFGPAPKSGDAFFDQDVADSRRLGGKLRRRR